MTRRPPPRRGLISLASVFAVLALGLLLAAVWNAARVTHRKVEAQVAADDAAHAAGVQAARGLNQVAAVNHLAGELLALAVLAHAAGGPELEDGPPPAAPTADLDAAFAAARLAPVAPDEALYRKARAGGAAGAAIGAARRTLLGELADAYRRQATDPAAALRDQAAVAAEWDTLDRLEAVARAELVPLKRLCVGSLVPDLARHARAVAEGTPARMEAAAAEVGRAHAAEATFLPRGRPALPVVPESAAVAAGGWERSQLVRAAAPWVRYWRQPALAFADRNLPRSRYAAHYWEWTNTYTLDLARRLGEEAGVYLYVPAAGDAAPFGHVWTARRPAATLFGPAVFRQPRPSGVAAAAQVDLYVAGGPDTLAWDPAVPAPGYDPGPRPDAAPPVPQPWVRLGWRARLAPVTGSLPAPFDHPAFTH